MLCFPFALFLLLGTDNSSAMKDVGKQVLKVKSIWRFYLEENGKRMIMATEKNGTIVDCYAFGDEYLIKVALKVVPNAKVLKLDSRVMKSVMNYCIYAKWSKAFAGNSGEEVWTEFGIFSAMLIYPGTKWCGAGNVSESYDDLGPEEEADRCCRDHDHCEDAIDGFSSKYGLTNYSPFTKSHCDCDDEFHECMREAGTKTSNRIGRIYFNYIQVNCFRNEHPIIGCKRHVGLFRRRCQEYILDEEQEPIWQFFDAKYYQRKSDDEDNEIEDTNQNDVFDYILNFSPDSRNLTDNMMNKDFFSNYSMRHS